MPDTFTTIRRPLATDQNHAVGAILGCFGRWRPSVTLTLPIAERCRYSLMRSCGGSVPWQISGKDSRGRPRVGHDHLYILPFSTAEGRLAHLDRVLLWARGGLEPRTIEVIEQLSQRGGRLQMRGEPPLRMEVLALGTRAQLNEFMPSRIFGPTRVWRSATAFIPPRFPKLRRGTSVDAADLQLSSLATAVLGSAPRSFTPIDPLNGRWSDFVQERSKPLENPRRPASGWMLHFAHPIEGPVILGHHAHYGLGRFEVSEATR